jgi:hypothetical protein
VVASVEGFICDQYCSPYGVTMCHEYTSRVWDRDQADEDTETDDEMPEFANEDGDDVEVLTDGGDDES